MAESPLQATSTMTALVRDRYGDADVLRYDQVEGPGLPSDGVLVRVRAASVNRIDWYEMAGRPLVARAMLGLRKPKSQAMGSDFAGVVEAVGDGVSVLQVGDEVFGAGNGAFADVIAVKDGVAQKPSHLTFEEAAAVPLAGLTALQGLRDKGQVTAGQQVLVNGSSGGVGTFAVQIAKALGAEVTAVCSTGNVETARSLGADRVIDYTREDFTRARVRYDVVFDNAGNRSWSSYRRVLTPTGTLVLVGGPLTNHVMGPLGHMVRMRLATLGSDRKAVFSMANINRPDLETLRDMVEAGTVKPVIDRRYQFDEIADALRYLGQGHAAGKVVVAGRPSPS